MTKYPEIAKLVQEDEALPVLVLQTMSGAFDEAIEEHLKYADEQEVANSIVEFNGI